MPTCIVTASRPGVYRDRNGIVILSAQEDPFAQSKALKKAARAVAEAAPKCQHCGKPLSGVQFHRGGQMGGYGKSGASSLRGGRTDTREEAGLCVCPMLSCKIDGKPVERETFASEAELREALDGYLETLTAEPGVTVGGKDPVRFFVNGREIAWIRVSGVK